MITQINKWGADAIASSPIQGPFGERLPLSPFPADWSPYASHLTQAPRLIPASVQIAQCFYSQLLNLSQKNKQKKQAQVRAAEMMSKLFLRISFPRTAEPSCAVLDPDKLSLKSQFNGALAKRPEVRRANPLSHLCE